MASPEQDRAWIGELWSRVAVRSGEGFPDAPLPASEEMRILFVDRDAPAEVLVARGSKSIRPLADEADFLALLKPRAAAPAPVALLAFDDVRFPRAVLLLEHVAGRELTDLDGRLPGLVNLLWRIHGTRPPTPYPREHVHLVRSLSRVAGALLTASQKRFLVDAAERRVCTSSLAYVHGDVRMANIILTGRGVRLIDFEHGGLNALEQDLAGLLLACWPSRQGIDTLATEIVRLYANSLQATPGVSGRITPCVTCALLYSAHRLFRNLTPSRSTAWTSFVAELLDAFGQEAEARNGP